MGTHDLLEPLSTEVVPKCTEWQ